MRKLRILSILDEFTYTSLKFEQAIEIITKKPIWYRKSNKIDFILVESAWRGNNDQWRYKIATYPNHSDRNNHKIIQLISWAKEHHIPTVFWNKEDPYHYDQFIDSAKLFDHIFTTDDLSLERYKKDALHSKVHVLPFFIQTNIHKPELTSVRNRSLFIGSYHSIEHPERRIWQNKIFPQAAQYGLTILNRHSKCQIIEQKFPIYPGDVEYLPAVPYNQTHHIYNQFSHCLNVNSITNSNTMFSRRLIEIMACGKLAISNPSKSISNLFKEMCICLDDENDANEILQQLSRGYTSKQKVRCQYAQQHVHQNYNVERWIDRILKEINI